MITRSSGRALHYNRLSSSTASLSAFASLNTNTIRLFQSKSKADQSSLTTSTSFTDPANHLLSLEHTSPLEKPSRTETVKISTGYEGTSWSSPNDNISVNTFSKDYSHLWTLLEACLDTQNFSRAQDVLINFSKRSKGSEVTVAVNNYLLRLAEVNEKDASVASKWLNMIESELENTDFKPSSVTYAILLRNVALASNYDSAKLKEFFTEASEAYFFNKKYSVEHDLLRNVDILGIDVIAKIISVSLKVPYGWKQITNC